jgi:hypothetical protein
VRVSHRILKRILKQGFGLTQLKASLTVVLFFFWGGGGLIVFILQKLELVDNLF